eukprot:10940475-Alexandrium_andersonii.AAC.1
MPCFGEVEELLPRALAAKAGVADVRPLGEAKGAGELEQVCPHLAQRPAKPIRQVEAPQVGPGLGLEGSPSVVKGRVLA